jgi:hypothetical protein
MEYTHRLISIIFKASLHAPLGQGGVRTTLRHGKLLLFWWSGQCRSPPPKVED